jgi:hypothetical protein
MPVTTVHCDTDATITELGERTEKGRETADRNRLFVGSIRRFLVFSVVSVHSGLLQLSSTRHFSPIACN